MTVPCSNARLCLYAVPGQAAIMGVQAVEYRGYTIVPKLTDGGDGRWYGGYEISKNGVPVSTRSYIFPGFLYSEAACDDSAEHAKIEIENLIAMKGGTGRGDSR